MRETLTAAETVELARFDDHWRVILADDNAMLVRSLAKRGYLDVLKRRVPLYRLRTLPMETLKLRPASRARQKYSSAATVVGFLLSRPLACPP